MTKNRVYVTLDKTTGDPSYISYYDKSNKKRKQIDLNHFHNGMKPHVHHGYEHNENDTSKGAARLTAKEKQMTDTIMMILATPGQHSCNIRTRFL